MSKMNELNLLVQELKKCGESLVNIADELAEIFSETGEKKTAAPADPAKEYTFTGGKVQGRAYRGDQEDS